MEDTQLKVNRFKITFGHPHDIAAILEVFVLDVYPVKSIKEGDVVLDLGAGIGEYSLLASKAVGPDGFIV